MEQHTLTFPGGAPVARRSHVGVVGSGDLEVLLEPADDGVTIDLRTSVNGFDATWTAVLERFFSRAGIAAKVQINDFGATPGTVALRLAQAVEAAK
ncbi:malonate decarboxylase subunit delta [Streptomyces sp. J2-1]|uniref:malonate decarboxylase subunit delta n=1 Tax=Streptomyces corallincola TaxID=2851888 RepID=UPI001C38C355|nr:malonate decarboxylase subunit delta [Streptomyces corallincola]MBV2353876.1 malonate decarboxylase subunit delta [Streptomyces corallincola]